MGVISTFIQNSLILLVKIILLAWNLISLSNIA